MYSLKNTQVTDVQRDFPWVTHWWWHTATGQSVGLMLGVLEAPSHRHERHRKSVKWEQTT